MASSSSSMTAASTPGGVDSTSTVVLDSSNERIRDYKLATEYKYLTTTAPAGVYVLPEFDNLRILHGVIFVRRGLYRDGVFRFRIDLPAAYNEVNAHPVVTFTPPIFNPLVDMTTGRLDLTVDESMREWQPDKHFLVTCITFIKKIFYLKSYAEFHTLPNEEARNLFNNDKDEFLQRVTTAVTESQKRLYDSGHATCPLTFTEPKPAHAEVIKEILVNRKLSTGTTGDDIGGLLTHTRDLGLGDDDDLLDRHEYSGDQLSLDHIDPSSS